jgi:hypothetical protein
MKTLANIGKWIARNVLTTILIAAAIGLGITGIVDQKLAIGIVIGAGAALGIAYVAAGEAPWKD